MEAVLKFIYEKAGYDNKIIDFYTAAWCRQTGRIFPNCYTMLDTIHVDWTFLKKRQLGNWVSWGSLSEMEQVIIEAKHKSLEGYQFAHSSTMADPSKVEKKYIYLKPGPLYVDVASGTLLGWQCVPETDLEVLIVQKPNT